MKFKSNKLKNFSHYFRHECNPNGRGFLESRRREHLCPVCRAKWETSGNNGWRHSTDGTEGWVVAVIMEYPDGTHERFDS